LDLETGKSDKQFGWLGLSVGADDYPLGFFLLLHFFFFSH
jgi:hypothetical protein